MPVFGSWFRASFAVVAVTILAAACGQHAANSGGGQTPGPSGDPKAGAALVQSSNCAGCHGGRFQGDLAPKLVGIEKRRTPAQIAGAITNPEAPMPKFDFSPRQVLDIVAYLSQLDAETGAQPKISIAPAKPTDSAMVSVSFQGTPPSDATVEAAMKMGRSTMGTGRLKLKKTNDPHTLRAKVPFDMGGSWMVKVRYDKTHEVDTPINVGE